MKKQLTLLFALALTCGLTFITSCQKDTVSDKKVSIDTKQESPFPNEITKVSVDKNGIATIETSTGGTFRKNVRANSIKRKQLLLNAKISSDSTEIDIIPAFPPSTKSKLSSISVSEGEDISSVWELTYVKVGGRWTVTIWPAKQWISDYEVRATLFDEFATSNSISFMINYIYIRNGIVFYSTSVPHARTF